MTPMGAATTPDSLAYLDIANNLKNGRGYKATNFSLDSYQDSRVTEKRAWPPLYPALLSLVIDDSSDTVAAASLSKVLLFIAGSCVFMTLAPLAGSGLALLLTCLFFISVPTITVYTYTWSETLFLALLCFSSHLSIRYLSLDSTVKKITCVLFLTLLLIGMAYTRYIGIVYFSILALTYLLSHRSKMESMLFGIAAAVYLAAISYWLYDNYLVTGHLSGVERSPSTTSIAEILRLILSAASVSVPENPPVIITLAVVAACLAYALNRAPRPPVVVQRNGDLQIVAIIAIPCTAYLLAMVILSRTSQFDPMDIRLLSPVFPAIFLLASILCLRTRRSGTLFMPVGASACFLILSLSFEGYGTFVSSLRNWHEHGKPLQRNSSNSTYNNFTMGNNNVNRQVFTALVEPGGVLVIKQAALQAFLTGLRCIEKPQALDAVSIAKMNTLPAGSLLVVSKSNKPALDALLADLETKGRYIDLDTLVAVKLPIKSR